MRTGIVVFLLLGLVNLSTPCFAADWARIGPGEYYIDRASVIQNHTMLWFWELAVDPASGDKTLIQYAVRLPAPYRISSYWGCRYNAKNQLLDGILHTHSLPDPVEQQLEQEIHTALQYAKDGEYSDTLPELPVQE